MSGPESQPLCQALAMAIREASMVGQLVGKEVLLADAEGQSGA